MGFCPFKIVLDALNDLRQVQVKEVAVVRRALEEHGEVVQVRDFFQFHVFKHILELLYFFGDIENLKTHLLPKFDKRPDVVS